MPTSVVASACTSKVHNRSRMVRPHALHGIVAAAGDGVYACDGRFPLFMGAKRQAPMCNCISIIGVWHAIICHFFMCERVHVALLPRHMHMGCKVPGSADRCNGCNRPNTTLLPVSTSAAACTCPSRAQLQGRARCQQPTALQSAPVAQHNNTTHCMQSRAPREQGRCLQVSRAACGAEVGRQQCTTAAACTTAPARMLPAPSVVTT